MKGRFSTFASAALIGLLLILPLVIMEIVNRREYNEEFPIVLFFGCGKLWSLSA